MDRKSSHDRLVYSRARSLGSLSLFNIARIATKSAFVKAPPPRSSWCILTLVMAWFIMVRSKIEDADEVDDDDTYLACTTLCDGLGGVVYLTRLSPPSPSTSTWTWTVGCGCGCGCGCNAYACFCLKVWIAFPNLSCFTTCLCWRTSFVGVWPITFFLYFFFFWNKKRRQYLSPLTPAFF